MKDRVVELKDRAFEFMQHGEYTGHYTRGIIVNETNSQYTVELLFNGKQYKVDKGICVEI